MSKAQGQFTIIDYNDALTLTGYIGSNLAKTQMYNPDNDTYNPDWTDTNLVLTGSGLPMTVKEAAALRIQMETVYQLATPSMTPDEIIQNRVMCKPWEKGSHTVGEVYEAIGQVWQCIQSYDNEVYPDIAPGNAAWGTFHKPYHGTTKETALPWVAPTGAHDMYLTGEYMVWTDGLIYKCLSSTAYSPEDYAGAWEVVE